MRTVATYGIASMRAAIARGSSSHTFARGSIAARLTTSERATRDSPVTASDCR